jgi:hypothetical protein
MNDWTLGNNQASGYPPNTPFWARGGSFGLVTDPRQMQAVNNAWLNTNSLAAMQYAAYRPPAPKPTMTLAEYDARRAAFRHAP